MPTNLPNLARQLKQSSIAPGLPDGFYLALIQGASPQLLARLAATLTGEGQMISTLGTSMKLLSKERAINETLVSGQVNKPRLDVRLGK